MRSSRIVTWLVVASGVILFIGTGLFGDREWWPTSLRGPIAIRSGVFLGGLILLAIWLGWSTWAGIRGKSNVLLTHNGRHIINPNDGAHVAGPFVCRRIGGVNVPEIGISFAGGDGTLVYPTAAIAPFGDSWLIRGVEKVVSFPELPGGVRDCIRRNGLPGPYRIVYAPHHVETRGMDWTEDERKVMVANAAGEAIEQTGMAALRALEGYSRVLAMNLQDVGRPVPRAPWTRRLFRPEDREPSPPREDRP